MRTGSYALSKAVWMAVKQLQAGLSTFSPAVTIKLKKPNGELCTTDAENAEVFAGHFGKVLNIDTPFDHTVLALIKQRPVRGDLDDAPDMTEVAKAIRKMRNNKAAGDSVPVEYLKAILDSPATFDLFMDVINDFWLCNITPEEWNVLRLKVLPKKGDLSNVGKWRGIFLMDVACKVISKIVTDRLATILAEFGMEAQNGFMSGRGCSDGIFLLFQALDQTAGALPGHLGSANRPCQGISVGTSRWTLGGAV